MCKLLTAPLMLSVVYIGDTCRWRIALLTLPMEGVAAKSRLFSRFTVLSKTSEWSDSSRDSCARSPSTSDRRSDHNCAAAAVCWQSETGHDVGKRPSHLGSRPSVCSWIDAKLASMEPMLSSSSRVLTRDSPSHNTSSWSRGEDCSDCWLATGGNCTVRRSRNSRIMSTTCTHHHMQVVTCQQWRVKKTLLRGGYCLYIPLERRIWVDRSVTSHPWTLAVVDVTQRGVMESCLICPDCSHPYLWRQVYRYALYWEYYSITKVLLVYWVGCYCHYNEMCVK